MSEVKRYYTDGYWSRHTSADDVEIVLATDYAALETERDAALAECERLRGMLIVCRAHAMDSFTTPEDEVAALKLVARIDAALAEIKP